MIYSSHKIFILKTKTDFKNYIDTTLVKYLDKIKINKWGQNKKISYSIISLGTKCKVAEY